MPGQATRDLGATGSGLARGRLVARSRSDDSAVEALGLHSGLSLVGFSPFCPARRPDSEDEREGRDAGQPASVEWRCPA
jgi:hypothetical protein